MKHRIIIVCYALVIAVASLPTGSVWASQKAAETKQKFRSPAILVLGDSQLAFGSGPVFLNFFSDIKHSCMPKTGQVESLKKLGDMSVGIIGVRSTSLASWAARKGRSKDKVCKVDRKWKSNAATFGIVNSTNNKYVQIGKGREYQFCKKGKSPFEVMFAKDYYKPKLLILSFLGNSAHRWAGNRQSALRDVEKTMMQLPQGVPCIFMTTAPTYKKKTVDLRLKAQENVKYAFMKNSSRCSFVEGFTKQTVAANLGNKSHFKQRKSGRVKDPFHPNRKAAEKFFSVETDRICKAVFNQLQNVRQAQLQIGPGPQ
ncbi:MAG: SGNH/GDSL hydrolase family protein [Rhizobiaceae bacterium]|nr:SGNH/GDSL hydrolase family protein [Rhizobiaceae bacterium]